MKFIVYLDIFFVVNLGMNMTVIVILKRLINERTRFLKMLLSSNLGALGACIGIILPMNLVCRFIFLYVFISFGMIVILYGFCGWIRLFKHMVMFYIVAFVLGGVVDFIWYRLNQTMSLRLLVPIVLLVIIIFFLLLRWWKGWGGTLQNIYEVELLYHGKTVNGYGLLDTGNHLREPISQKAVVVAEFEWVKDLFPPEMEEIIGKFPNMEEHLSDRVMVRWIPYHSIGEDCGALTGVKIDTLSIWINNKRQVYQEVYMAICKERVSSNNTYQVILQEEFCKNY